ncbi:hypothetical protein KIN20_024439 [Parelaphostrongylus tenuis]|uniref:Uncharacterized protein n=1 Tax=Parelaphostrongylus tenuis TaxID=148309 RepID=A0AAD5N7K8_PARTN|nr:hypothetical protein KIN20_024439 [Parelaphostrongylus tenuis]
MLNDRKRHKRAESPLSSKNILKAMLLLKTRKGCPSTDNGAEKKCSYEKIMIRQRLCSGHDLPSCVDARE